MARRRGERWASDDRRRRIPPFVRVPWAIRNPANPAHGLVYHVPEARGVWLGMLVTARHAMAGRADDTWTIARGDLAWVTGRRRFSSQVAAVRSVTGPLEWPLAIDERVRSVRVQAPGMSRIQRWLKRGRPPGALPDVFVHTAIQTPDPRQSQHADVFGSPELRGVWVGLLICAARAWAGLTDDRVLLSAGDLLWVTGRSTREGQLPPLERVCKALEYEHGAALEGVSVRVRNLSTYQRWNLTEPERAARAERHAARARARNRRATSLADAARDVLDGLGDLLEDDE